MNHRISCAVAALSLLAACGGGGGGTTGGLPLAVTAGSPSVLANGTATTSITVTGDARFPVVVQSPRGTFENGQGSVTFQAAPMVATLRACDSRVTAGCAGTFLVNVSDAALASARVSITFVPVEICDDQLDNNGNGQTDCAEQASCPTGTVCSAGGKQCGAGACATCLGNGGAPEVAEVSCGDGFDNDCDGVSDCADPDCAGDVCLTAPSTTGGLTTGTCSATTQACTCTAVAETGARCGNGLDDDCDGLIDCEDPNCQDLGAGGQACDTLGHTCSAAVAGVSTCTTCTGNGGAAQGAEADCADGNDNDCDGLRDCADTDCAAAQAVCSVTFKTCSAATNQCVCQGPEAARELTCGDGQDNDCDGKIDCADTDCATRACTAFGSTCSATQVGTCTCSGNGGAPQQGAETTCSDGRDNDCDGVADCNDSNCGPTPGTSYGVQCSGTATNVLRCDGLAQCACTGNGGTPEPVEQSCGDTRDNDCDGLVDCADPDCGARACNAAGRTCTSLAGVSNTCSVCTPPGAPAIAAEVAEGTCGDGRDNDCDGTADCNDTDCVNRTCLGAAAIGGGSTTGKCTAARACVCTPVAETAALCGNGLDDDCDGRIDCEDTNCQDLGAGGQSCDALRHLTCSSPLAPTPGCTVCTPGGGAPVQYPGQESVCSDGRDNDCDGVSDCADPDCAASTFACAPNGFTCDPSQFTCTRCSGNGGAAEAVEATCADAADNDCDGAVDCADATCRGQACNAFGMRCTSPASGAATCTVCSGNGGVAEAAETSCGDGFDNDCDGLADCADTGCAARSCGGNGEVCSGATCVCGAGGASEPVELSCGDNRDNDCDGLADCADPSCQPAGAAPGRACGLNGRACTAAAACACSGNGGVPQAAEALCADGFDNDCDGLADCADTTCASAACPFPVSGGGFTTGFCSPTLKVCACTAVAETGALCGDGRDNDCDGRIDCLDENCQPVGSALGQTCDARGNRCAPAVGGVSTCTICAPAGDPINAQATGAETKCADGFDNDCDGRADCQDATCASLALACDATGKTCTPALLCRCPDTSGTEVACDDHADNDCDGKVDCADTQCQPAGSTPGRTCGPNGLVCNAVGGGTCACAGNGGVPQGSEALCADGFDNDCDGLVDCADPSCQPTTPGTLANACRSAAIAFGGKCDVFGQCVCPGGQAAETTCTDGLDNDCDGTADCLDPDCAGAACLPSSGPNVGTTCLTVSATGCGCPGGQATETTCDDGTDNDCDGRVDCGDADCADRDCQPGSTVYKCLHPTAASLSYVCKDGSSFVLALSAGALRLPADGSGPSPAPSAPVTTTVTVFLQNATTSLTPVVGASVALSATGGTLSAASVTTGADGRAAVTFTPSTVAQTAVVTATYAATSGPVVQTLPIVLPALSSITLASQDFVVMGARDSGYQELNELTFLLADATGQPYPAGLRVDFQHAPAGGSFIEVTGVPVSCSQVLCTTHGVTDATGRVRVLLRSGSVAGTLSVSARASAGGTGLKTVSAGNIAIVGARANGNEITITCSPQNIPALIATDCTNSNYFGADATVACRVVVNDRYKNKLGVPSLVQFFAEAGAMGASATTPAYDPTKTPAQQASLGTTTGIYSASGAKLPVDVAPQPGEFSFAHDWDGCAPPGGTLIHNPRDGLVTVIAVAQGEEGFFDASNGCPANGLYDAPGSAGCALGERFVDLGEPFVDLNDNGVRDSTSSGGEFDEPYFDANNNGVWNGPNATWDRSTTIWAETRLLYTGYVEARGAGPQWAASRFFNAFPFPFTPAPSDPASFFVLASTTTPPPGTPATSQGLGVYMTDLNFNLPNYKTTYGVSKPGGAKLTFTLENAPTTTDDLGMLFRQLYCDGQNPGTCASSCNWNQCVRRSDATGFQYGSFGSVSVTGGSAPDGGLCLWMTATLRTTNTISSISTERSIDIPVCGQSVTP
ncbi:MAG: Ig-like domain-containing protein [Anaeromyxobacter sp.]|nr:Ig-like domain-containing protein [Anaeromyxobacter sp.]MBL0276595.1 Ig-like domain-containing protein [Anaeromyxobacter sp.]